MKSKSSKNCCQESLSDCICYYGSYKGDGCHENNTIKKQNCNDESFWKGIAIIDELPNESNIPFKLKEGEGNSIKQVSQAIFYLKANKKYIVNYDIKLYADEFGHGTIIPRLNEEKLYFGMSESSEVNDIGEIKLEKSFEIVTDDCPVILDFVLIGSECFLNGRGLLCITELSKIC